MAYSFCDVDNAYDNNIQKQINKLEKSFNEHKNYLFKNAENTYFDKNDEYNDPYIENIKGTSIKKLKNKNLSSSDSSSDNNEKIQSYDDLSLLSNNNLSKESTYSLRKLRFCSTFFFLLKCLKF